MKNKLKKSLVALAVAITMLNVTVFSANVVYAAEGDDSSDDTIIVLSDGTEVHQQIPDEIMYIENNNDGENTEFPISNPVVINEEDIVVNHARAVVAGEGQDFLTETGDMKLYPLQLNPGVYLQAQMMQPNNINLDYDLYILNSEGYILAYSDNYTKLNGAEGTLVESCGCYTNETNQSVYYIAVMSSNGGSVSEPFTIQYSVSNVYDFLEPSENPREALPFTIGANGASISMCSLSSPIDNDWYYIDVPENRIYDKLHLEIMTDSCNSPQIEVYRNTSDTSFMMSKVFSTTDDAFMNVTTGRYYIRICNIGAMEDFDNTDIQNYTFTVTPRLKADGIRISEFDGNEGVNRYVSYPGFSRSYFRTTNWIKVSGYVTATDPDTGIVYGVADHDVSIMYFNPYWYANNTSSMAQKIEYGVSNADGSFAITMSSLPTPMGACTWNAGLTTQYFDICGISAYLTEQPSIIDADEFVHYKYSLYN